MTNMLGYKGIRRCISVLLHYLTNNLFQIRGLIREQFWFAAQLLSDTVAVTMKTHLPEIEEGACFIELVDKAFDIMSSNKKSSDKEERCGFGVHLEQQTKVTLEFEDIISKVRFGDQTNLLPFQEGYIVSMRALRGLFSDMTSEEGIPKLDFILTSKLSLDCVHDIFTKIRMKDNTDYIPNAVEAKAQLRLLLIGANKDVVSNAATGENTSEEGCISSQVLSNIPELVEEVLKNKDPDHDILLPDIVSDDLDQKYAQLIQEVCTEQTVEKMEDFCQRFRPDLPYVYAEEIIETNCPTLEQSLDQTPGNIKKKKKVSKFKETMWIQTLTKGGVKVSSKWCGKFREFENDFNALHNSFHDCLSRDAGITNKLVRILNTKWPRLDNRILKRYARLRTQIRLRFVIKKYEQQWVVIEQ